MIYSLLADIIVVIHLGWILFLMLGWIIGRRVRWVKWIHIGGLGYSLLLQIQSWICPLTHLEVWLRRRAPIDQPYSSSFIEHYVEGLVYWDMSPAVIFVFTAVVITVSGIAYYRAN